MGSTFFCDLSALTPLQRDRHRQLSQFLRPLVVEFQELSNGYTAVVGSSERIDSEIEEFLLLEKLCCPFFALKLNIEKGGETEYRVYNVEITGPGEIKPFIRLEFGIPQNDDAT